MPHSFRQNSVNLSTTVGCFGARARQRYHNNYKYHFNEDKFNEDYIKFEDFFYREQFVMRDSIRLINFVSNVDEIMISDDLKIVKLTEEDYDMRARPNRQ